MTTKVAKDIDGHEVGAGDLLRDTLTGKDQTVSAIQGGGRYYLFEDGRIDLTATAAGSTVYRLVRRADGTSPTGTAASEREQRRERMRERVAAKRKQAEQVAAAQAMIRAEQTSRRALADDPTPLTIAGRYRLFRESFEARARELAPYATPIVDRITLESEFNVFAELSQGNASVHTTIPGALHQPETAGADAASFLASKLQYELSLTALKSPPAMAGRRAAPVSGLDAGVAGGARPRFADRGSR